MNEARARMVVESIQKAMKELLDQCPELTDVCMVINWDRAEYNAVPREAQTPTALVFSNRSTSNEAVAQLSELAHLAHNTGMSLTDKALMHVIEENRLISESIGKMRHESSEEQQLDEKHTESTEA